MHRINALECTTRSRHVSSLKWQHGSSMGWVACPLCFDPDKQGPPSSGRFLAPEAIAHSTNLSFKKGSSPRLSLSPFSFSFFLTLTRTHLHSFRLRSLLSTPSSVPLPTLQQKREYNYDWDGWDKERWIPASERRWHTGMDLVQTLCCTTWADLDISSQRGMLLIDYKDGKGVIRNLYISFV